MSFNSASPTNYGFEGDPLLEAYMNAKFSEEISEKMKVPKRITANGQEIEHEILNGNQVNSWNYYEKHDMTVPDRIVVIGQDQHLGELKSKISNFSLLYLHFSHSDEVIFR
jgi:mitochondrial fission factor